MFKKQSDRHGKSSKSINGLSPQNKIISELNGGDYVNNSLIYSQLGGNITKVMAGIYYAIVYAMQEPFGRVIGIIKEGKRKEEEMKARGASEEDIRQMKEKLDIRLFKEGQVVNGMQLTKDEDGGSVVRFTIPLAKAGISNKNYKVVEETMKQMAKTTYSFDERQPDGRYARVYESAFQRVRMEYEKYGTERRYSGTMTVEMRQSVAERVFSLGAGYVRHLGTVGQIAKGMGASLYRYLAQLNSSVYGGHGDLPYNDVKEFFGVFEYNEDRTGPRIIKDDEGNDKPVDSYPAYAHFKRDVLERTRKELDSLCKDGKIDYSFDYEPLYLNGKKRGVPDYLRFHLMTAQAVADRDNNVQPMVEDAVVVHEDTEVMKMWKKFLAAAAKVCDAEQFVLWSPQITPVSANSELVVMEGEVKTHCEFFYQYILCPAWQEFTKVFGPTVKPKFELKSNDNSRSGQCSVPRSK